MNFDYESIAIIVSGLLYSYVSSFGSGQWGLVLWYAQHCCAFTISLVGGSALRIPEQPVRATLTGITFAVSVGLPIALVQYGWIDYALVSFVRIAALVFSLIFQWHQLTRAHTTGTALMCVAQLLAWGNTTNHTMGGFFVALLAAAASATTGWLQSGYARYDPYGNDARFMHLCAVATAFVATSFSALWRLPLLLAPEPLLLLGIYAIQTIFINAMLRARRTERTRNIYLGVLLGLRKVLSTTIAIDWISIPAPVQFIGALVFATASIMTMNRKS